MRSLGRTAAALMAMVLSACGASTAVDLRKEVDRAVVPGMAVADAVETLQARGFNCTASREPSFDGITCTRHRTVFITAACIHRLNLELDTTKRVVTAVQVPEPLCAGL